MGRWQLLGSKLAALGTKSAILGRFGEQVDRKKADKATLREFYKTVRAKPKGRGHREGTKAFDAGA